MYILKLFHAAVKTPFKKFYVDIGNCVGGNDKIWTLAMNTEIDHAEIVPMVLLHGYVSALAFWMLNYDSFAAERAVYAVDLLGFGKSSRYERISHDSQEKCCMLSNVLQTKFFQRPNRDRRTVCAVSGEMARSNETRENDFIR
jgi:pimeloyl-ACP methyl ester carboxylesterase